MSISNISPGTWHMEGSGDPLLMKAEWWPLEDERLSMFPPVLQQRLRIKQCLVWWLLKYVPWTSSLGIACSTPVLPSWKLRGQTSNLYFNKPSLRVILKLTI